MHALQAMNDVGKHTDTVTGVKRYYASNSVWDDMCLAAVWLARRCGGWGARWCTPAHGRLRSGEAWAQRLPNTPLG